LEHLTHYDWPGNVRELFNCARYLTGLTVGDVANLSDLPPRIREAAVSTNRAERLETPRSDHSAETGPRLDAPSIRYDLAYKPAKRLWLEVFEYAYISRLLEKHNGNISHAARSAGIDRKSIQRLMKRNLMSSGANTPEDSD
jgi:two-component system response regulator HydG